MDVLNKLRKLFIYGWLGLILSRA